MFQHGHDVVLVARGDARPGDRRARVDGRVAGGLGDAPVPVVAHPGELTFGPTTSCSSPSRARTRLASSTRSAGGAARTPIVCLQNGVANEPAFLRRFEHVHGVPVMAPTCAPRAGRRAAPTRTARPPSSTSGGGRRASTTSPRPSPPRSGRRASSRVARPDIARWKYTKLLLNLGNPIDALCPPTTTPAGCAELATAPRGRPVLDGRRHRPRQRRRGPRPARRHAAHRPVGGTARGRAGRRGRAWPAASRSRSTTSTARSSCSAGCTAWPRRSTPCCSARPIEAVAERRPPGTTPAATLLARVSTVNPAARPAPARPGPRRSGGRPNRPWPPRCAPGSRTRSSTR